MGRRAKVGDAVICVNIEHNQSAGFTIGKKYRIHAIEHEEQPSNRFFRCENDRGEVTRGLLHFRWVLADDPHDRMIGVADPVSGQMTFYGPFNTEEDAIAWAEADGIPERHRTVFELRMPRKT